MITGYLTMSQKNYKTNLNKLFSGFIVEKGIFKQPIQDNI